MLGFVDEVCPDENRDSGHGGERLNIPFPECIRGISMELTYAHAYGWT